MIHYIVRDNENYSSSAGYNRVRLICEGFLENKVSVKLHLLLFKNKRRKVSSLLERYCFSYIRHLNQLLEILKHVTKQDIVIIYDIIDQFWMLNVFAKKTNLIIEQTEYPYYEIYEKVNRIKTYYIKKNLEGLKKASALITCSTYLRDYYRRYCDDVLIIPLVVDLKEFLHVPHKSKGIGEYVAYCGNFNDNKDGLPILLKAFGFFFNNHPQFKLVLIGSGSPKTINHLKGMVEDLGLNDAVVFTGRLPHEQVSAWLTGATILALARPNTRQAEGGIPSKVGEYLASGVPSVLTKTGDLPHYLNDGVDCFLCEPDSEESFANRLEDCYQSDMKMTGINARETAIQFSNNKQAKVIIDYINNKYGTSCLQ